MKLDFLHAIQQGSPPRRCRRRLLLSPDSASSAFAAAVIDLTLPPALAAGNAFFGRRQLTDKEIREMYGSLIITKDELANFRPMARNLSCCCCCYSLAAGCSGEGRGRPPAGSAHENARHACDDNPRCPRHFVSPRSTCSACRRRALSAT